jgi:hypothetical protein
LGENSCRTSLLKRSYEKSIECVGKIKTSFANVGAYSSEDNFVKGNPEGRLNGSAARPKPLRRF